MKGGLDAYAISAIVYQETHEQAVCDPIKSPYPHNTNLPA